VAVELCDCKKTIMCQIIFLPILSAQEAAQPFICSRASTALGRKRTNSDPVARVHPGTRAVLPGVSAFSCWNLLKKNGHVIPK